MRSLNRQAADVSIAAFGHLAQTDRISTAVLFRHCAEVRRKIPGIGKALRSGLLGNQRRGQDRADTADRHQPLRRLARFAHVFPRKLGLHAGQGGIATAFLEGGGKILGRSIRDVNTVNGVRVTLEDGAWVLVRASSNKPELVVVVESTQSEDDMRALFREEVKPRLAKFPEVGKYNQEI